MYTFNRSTCGAEGCSEKYNLFSAISLSGTKPANHANYFDDFLLREDRSLTALIPIKETQTPNQKKENLSFNYLRTGIGCPPTYNTCNNKFSEYSVSYLFREFTPEKWGIKSSLYS
jgi:hypothetical protein